MICLEIPSTRQRPLVIKTCVAGKSRANHAFGLNKSFINISEACKVHALSIKSVILRF